MSIISSYGMGPHLWEPLRRTLRICAENSLPYWRHPSFFPHPALHWGCLYSTKQTAFVFSLWLVAEVAA